MTFTDDIIQYASMITFARYMEQELYGPSGYYVAGAAKSGKRGDYFTAPDVGPAFGQLLAEIFLGWREKLGSKDFSLVEIGAGEGTLAKDILARAQGIAYMAVDRSPARREKLKSLKQISVLADLDGLAHKPIQGVLFANEL